MGDKFNVAITGYIGSGSSAIIDLLKEFDECGLALNLDTPYEHVSFYSNGGLFDLGTIISNINSPFNSDAAINNFIDCTTRLNNNNFGWFGSYNYLTGNNYKLITEKFIERISTKSNGRTCNHYTKVRFSIIKAFLQIAARFIYKRKIYKLGRKYVFDNKNTYFAMPNKDEFFYAAKMYTSDYFEICKSNKKITLYDHLICPQHTHLINNYFDESKLKVIIVERDIRDLYILNKYYWYTPPIGNGQPLFPTDPYEFCDYWRRVINCENKADNLNVLKVKFEDLIYNYELTIDKIINFLDLSKDNHKNKNNYFMPNKSIKNTQTFKIKKEWKEEADIIFNELSEYCYDFPYDNTTSIKEMFDDSTAL